MKLTWTATQVEPGADAHVYPNNDLIQHVEDIECVCGPLIEPVPRQDGSLGWLVTHHSLDGREAHE